MPFKSLLNAIEQYVSARQVFDVKPSGSSSDWDCGLSGEFGESYSMSWQRGQQMAEARERLQAALDEYVDERVRIAVQNKSGA